MACLTNDMKNKRDVRRKSHLLIVDSDLGNMGLYKSLLSAEYEVDCAECLASAVKLCMKIEYDVVVVDSMIGIDSICQFFDWLKEEGNSLIKLVMVELQDKEFIVEAMCHGAWGNIPNPFTKEGMVKVLHDCIEEKRQQNIRQTVLLIDEDVDYLNQLKAYIHDKYNVRVMNTWDNVFKYVNAFKPSLIIADARVPAESSDEVRRKVEEYIELNRIHVLFISEPCNAEQVAKCTSYKPEGFMMKPIDKETFVSTVDRLLLMDSYIDAVCNKEGGNCR